MGALILKGLMPFCVEFFIVETGQVSGRRINSFKEE
jgi:hypothetical protein